MPLALKEESQKLPHNTSTNISLTRTQLYSHTELQGRLGYLALFQRANENWDLHYYGRRGEQYWCMYQSANAIIILHNKSHKTQWHTTMSMDLSCSQVCTWAGKALLEATNLLG